MLFLWLMALYPASLHCLTATGEGWHKLAGIQFTAGEHEFQLFHQQRKGLVQVVRICIAEQASDTGAVGKVMQPVTLLHQTCPETGRHGAGQPPPGAVVIVVGKCCPGECV